MMTKAIAVLGTALIAVVAVGLVQAAQRKYGPVPVVGGVLPK